MRKIYILLILLSLVTVLSFADSGWFNAQSEIQKSFNANSPATNVLQNQLFGSTNTNSGFLNLNGSSVNALGSVTGGSTHLKATVSTSVSISQSGTTTFQIQNELQGSEHTWSYWIGETPNWSSNGISFSVSSYSSNLLNLSVGIPSNLSPGTYIEQVPVYGGNYGSDNNIWEELINLTIFYKEQSYVATATSYDASYCGATGNVLTNSYKSSSNGVLLAELNVQSNLSAVTVNVSVNGGSLISPSGLPKGMVLSYSNSYNASTNVLTLPSQVPGSSYPNSGTLDIIASDSITPWVIPGQTVIEFQFTIVPKIHID